MYPDKGGRLILTWQHCASMQFILLITVQGHLNHERERVRQLKQRLTDLEAAYHATLDSLDRLQGPSGSIATASK